MQQLCRFVLILLLSAILVGPACAGKNAGGAMVVHTNDSVEYTFTTAYCGDGFDDPGSCEAAETRTDHGPMTASVIWLLAAFADDADPGVTVIHFGIDHNLPAGEGYFAGWDHCGEGLVIEIQDPGWPETGFGCDIGFGEPLTGRILFPFYWFALFGFEGAYFGTGVHPIDGTAAFVDDGHPGELDEIDRFGTVRWFEEGFNQCPDQPTAIEHRSWGALKIDYRSR